MNCWVNWLVILAIFIICLPTTFVRPGWNTNNNTNGSSNNTFKNFNWGDAIIRSIIFMIIIYVAFMIMGGFENNGLQGLDCGWRYT